MAGIGPEVFAETLRVVFDQRVGSVEDVAVRAVVLFQLDQVLYAKFALKVEHVADAGAAKGVDRIVRDDAVGDEVVRVFDIQIEHGGLFGCKEFNLGDCIESAGFVHHHHALAHHVGAHGAQWCGVQRGAHLNEAPQLGANLGGEAHHLAVVFE